MSNISQLWKVEQQNDEQKVTYLSTLSKHTQTVNVVRWSPRGDTLASAGDDGAIILWTQTELGAQTPAFGEEKLDELETWRAKKTIGSPIATEVYDLAWSPDGSFFITGSMDNIARIYNSTTGML
jgi:chromatin assembly factor 1 subunit B